MPLSRDEEARFNTLQEALEREDQRIALDHFHVRRALDHLRRVRRELATGKPLTPRET